MTALHEYLERYAGITDPPWHARLAADYAIDVSQVGSLLSLKYSFDSPMEVPVVRECRGAVVHESGKIVALPYAKFWNHGEAMAATIDWESARVLEKLDGSLAILYHYDGRWRWASSGNPTASGRYGKLDKTFGDVFQHVFETTWMATPGGWRQSVCFLFELIAPDNRIVCRYDRAALVLHGARDRDTGKEIGWKVLDYVATLHNWPIVPTHRLSTLDEVLKHAALMDPSAREGFVVVDHAGNRIKVKSPRYVALHHLKGESSPRRVIELWKAGELGELLTHFPELAAYVDPVVANLETIARSAYEDYMRHQPALLLSRKDFAAAVKDAPWSSVTFLMLKEDSPTLETARRLTRSLLTGALEKILERCLTASLEKLVERRNAL